MIWKLGHCPIIGTRNRNFQEISFFNKGLIMTKRPSGGSENFAKVFRIMDAFSVDQPEQGIRDIAYLLELPASTVGRIMTQLRDVGILFQDPETRRYRLSSRVLRWAKVSQAGNSLRELGLPILKALSQSTGETATLSVPQGFRRMVLERIETEKPVRYVVNPGDFMPFHSGASGKILLAFMAEEKRLNIIAETGLPALTPNTITDSGKLLQELESIKKQGYAISHGERVPDVASIAAPVRDMNGEVIAAINISGPINRFNDELLNKYSKLVIEAAQELSGALGYYKD